MKKDRSDMQMDTLLQRPPKVPLHPGNEPLIAPIYQSVKFTFDTYDSMVQNQMTSFFYSRVSNPTVRQLEKQLAELQGRDDAFCVASGVAALSIPLMALLQAGDHVILFTESYMPTRYLARDLMGKFGVTHTLLPTAEAKNLKTHIIKGKTKLILFETPTNPSLTVLDLKEITRVAQDEGVVTILDNTFAGFHQHGSFGVDIFVHSLTKYASGHGDVMGGAIIANDKLITQIRPVAWNIGATLDPHAAYLILRGMKTYSIRYKRQCQTASKVAEFLVDHSAIKSVAYPGLISHPQHELAKGQMKDFGTIVTAELKDAKKLSQFIDRLNLFHLAGSLGSTESLIAPAKRFFGGDLTWEQQEQARLHDGSFRLSIGVEHVEDLIQDLDQAL